MKYFKYITHYNIKFPAYVPSIRVCPTTIKENHNQEKTPSTVKVCVTKTQTAQTYPYDCDKIFCSEYILNRSLITQECDEDN